MKIGIKFASVKAIGGGIDATKKCELYNIETGETLEGITSVEFDYAVHKPIIANVRLIVSEVVGTDEPLYKDHPPVP